MDFNPISSIAGKASMKRKQSNSLLQALGKNSSRTSAIPIPPNAPTQLPPQPPGSASTYPSSSTHYSTPPTSSSSHFPDDFYTHPAQSPESPFYPESAFSRAASLSYNLPLHSSRSVSWGTSVRGSDSGDRDRSLRGRDGKDKDRDKDGRGNNTTAPVIKNYQDVLAIVKDRLFSWSYMMQWYQGEILWFNAVKVSRSALETSLGPSKVELRARNFFVLGTSLSSLFDISQAPEFLRGVLRLLDDWESFTEGSGGQRVKNLFRGQRGAKKGLGGAGGPGGDLGGGNMGDAESSLIHVNLPFPPDFYQVHSTLCSIFRDIYKKLLRMVLPSSSALHPSLANQAQKHRAPSSTDSNLLFHPSTHISSASIIAPPPSMSPGGQFPAQSSDSSPQAATRQNRESVQQDAFQAMVAGKLPPGHELVGEGQALTPQLIELFLKVDGKLKKHFSALLREGDALARRVVEDEIAMLTQSLYSGAPLDFDYVAAANGQHETTIPLDQGYYQPDTAPSGWDRDERSLHSTVESGFVPEADDDARERDFGTV